MTDQYGTKSIIKDKWGGTYDDLGLSSSSELDTLIDSINEEASDIINRYCRRDFSYHSGVTENYDANNRKTFATAGYPIISVSGLRVDDSLLDGGGEDYRIKKASAVGGSNVSGANASNAGIIEKYAGRWVGGWEAIEITYSWGYENPPPQVRGMAEDMTVNCLKRIKRNYENDGVQSISMDGFSVTYQEQPYLSEDQQARLDNFKRSIMV